MRRRRAIFSPGPRHLSFMAAALLVAAPRVAAACPSCDAAIAARAAIRSDPDLFLLAGVTVLPFLLVAILAILLHRVGRPGPRPQGDLP